MTTTAGFTIRQFNLTILTPKCFLMICNCKCHELTHLGYSSWKQKQQRPTFDDCSTRNKITVKFGDIFRIDTCLIKLAIYGETSTSQNYYFLMHTLYLQKCIYKVEKTEVNERAKTLVGAWPDYSQQGGIIHLAVLRALLLKCQKWPSDSAWLHRNSRPSLPCTA